MKPISILFLTCLMLSVPAVVPAADSANDLFQQALTKERTEGHLPEAMKLYQRILDRFASNHKVAAQALLQMAECQSRLGDTQSRKSLERLVRDFADQKDLVEQARAQLASPAGSAPATNFRMSTVWKNVPTPWISISQDGRYVAFSDASISGKGDLTVHDLTTGSDRRLTNTGTSKNASAAGEEGAEGSTFSKDGKQVAYVWRTKENRDELRIIDFQPSGFSQPRRLPIADQDVQFISSEDWSADGKWISAQLSGKGLGQRLALISTADGSLRVLKSIEGPYVATKAFFSPDSKYLAYDRPSGTAGQRDIFLLPVDGGAEVPAVVQALNSPASNMVMGWMPDGHLVYASDATGSVSLWALPMLNGKPQGTPTLVKSDIGNARATGVTRSGSVYYFTANRDVFLYTASVDLKSGKLTSPPVRLANQVAGSNIDPVWSPDGKQLAYVSQRSWGNQFGILSILSTSTGETREVRDFTQLKQFLWPSWSPDGRSIVAQGIDPKGNDGIYRVNAMTGGVEPLVIAEKGSHLSFPMMTPTGETLIYFRQINGSPGAMIQRDLSTGAERKLLDGVRPNTTGMPVLSPDGRYLHYVTLDDATKQSTLAVLPVAGGTPRELLRVQQPLSLRTGWWTPDGSSVIYQETATGASYSPIAANGPREFWLVGLNGGTPSKIDLPPGVGNIRTHPDGQLAVFTLPDNTGSELVAIENPLSASASK